MYFLNEKLVCQRRDSQIYQLLVHQDTLRSFVHSNEQIDFVNVGHVAIYGGHKFLAGQLGEVVDGCFWFG